MSHEIVVSRDFSKTPGARHPAEGKFSGEEFREKFLRPAFEGEERIQVHLDGTYGYSTGFLEEAFGGLARIFGAKAVEARVDFVSWDEPYLIEEIMKYIRAAPEEVAKIHNG